MSEITVADRFDGPTGEFTNYSVPLHVESDLIGNSFFESGITGWTPEFSTLSHVARPDGAGMALRVTATTSGSMQAYPSASSPVTPGASYTAYGELCTNSGGRFYQLQIIWQTSTLAYISTSSSTTSTAVGNRSITAIAPSTAAYALVVLNDSSGGSTGDYAEWDGVVLFSLSQQIQLQKQKHVDIRVFNNSDFYTQIVMLYLNTTQMQFLNSQQMSNLNGNIVIRYGEQWSGPGTQVVGKQADRNNWYGLTLPCTANATTTTTSILKAL